ncbi:MAG: C10 family peptidase [Candidatus Limimorpha sp.]
MKKYVLTFVALIFGITMLHAGPVDVSKAKVAGQQFVRTHFDLSVRETELSLAQTATSDRGDVYYYIFNVGREGFVIVSGEDTHRPIIGYSEESSFDANNVPDGLQFCLDELQENMSRSKAGKAASDPMTVAEWQSVLSNGTLIPRNRGCGSGILMPQKWNQTYPYNKFCPEQSASWASGGHAVTGCVATAMAQIMAYWKHPLQGQGTHSYTPPMYPTQTVNFGTTTYDWDNTVDFLNSNSTPEEIDAVALLSWHCGVAVNMGYDTDGTGSGAYSEDVPGAIYQYFKYSSHAQLSNRNSFTYDAWRDKLKESFDMGWPLFYYGRTTQNAGHAFVCDGYNSEDLFHYNWGWGGSGDGWFDFDGMEYATHQGAIFNFVPIDTYNNAPMAPTNLNVVAAPNNQLSTTITWTNPSKTLDNTTISTIDQIVVKRDGEIIHTENNVAGGANMTYVDNSVPRFDKFEYEVYAVQNGAHGKTVKTEIFVGPSCNWTIIMQTTSFQGWRGGSIRIFNAAGSLVDKVTTTGSAPSTATVDMPLGNVSFVWAPPAAVGDSVENMTFIIKNSEGASVYSYSGSSNNLVAGVFFTANNGCGNSGTCAVPSNLVATTNSGNANQITITWEAAGTPEYGYNLYRDGLLYHLITEGTTFVDENVPLGGHCYSMKALCNSGEGDMSNESCATAGEGCNAPRNLDYEKTGTTFKTKLLWEKPEPSDGLSGFFIFRKAEGGEYQRIKLVGANTTSYTDNSSLQEGFYYYKVYAYYGGIDCTSAPANSKYQPNVFYLRVYYSPTSVNETETAQVEMYPNPAKQSFTIEGEGLLHVSVFNLLGQNVFQSECNGNKSIVNLGNVENGMYVVRIRTNNGEVTKRITVIR